MKTQWVVRTPQIGSLYDEHTCCGILYDHADHSLCIKCPPPHLEKVATSSSASLEGEHKTWSQKKCASANMPGGQEYGIHFFLRARVGEFKGRDQRSNEGFVGNGILDFHPKIVKGNPCLDLRTDSDEALIPRVWNKTFFEISEADRGSGEEAEGQKRSFRWKEETELEWSELQIGFCFVACLCNRLINSRFCSKTRFWFNCNARLRIF